MSYLSLPRSRSDFTGALASGSTTSWAGGVLTITRPSTQFASTTAISKKSFNSGIIIAQADFNWATDGGGNEDIPGIKLTNSAAATSNQHSSVTSAQISARATGGTYRLTAGVSSWNSYDNNPGITKGKRVKIVYNASTNEISFWYWNVSAWTQMGTTQTYDIKGAGSVSLVLHHTNVFTSVGNATFGNIYFDTYASDYSTEFPTTGAKMEFDTTALGGLVGEYLFDGNANDTNDGTKYNGTATNLSYANGQVGYAKQYGFGSNARVTASHSAITGNWSMSFDAYRTASADNNGSIIECGTVGSAGFGCYIWGTGGMGVADGSVLWWVNNLHTAAADYIATNILLPLNAWTHVEMVYDGSYVRSYQDGVMKSEIPFTTNPSSQTTRCFFDRYGAAGNYYKGRLTNVRIWNRALTDRERLQLWHEFNRKLGGGGDFGSFVPAPVFQSETDGTNSFDVANAGTSSLTGSRATANDRFGLSTAYSFNGSSNENFGDNALWSPSANPITIVTEFYQTSTPGTDYGGLVAKYVSGNAGSSEFFFATHSTGKLYITGNGSNVVTTASSYVVNNTWQCAAAVIRATGAKIYQEDMTVASGNLTLGSDTGTGLFLGDFSSADKKFNGRIGRTFIFPGELTSDQIKFVFGCMKSGRYPYAFRRSILDNLRRKANWWFGYGDRDISGNANHGTSTSVTAVRNGQCLGGSYNGSSSYIETGTAQALDACTFAATIQVGSTGSNQVIIGQRATGSSQKNLVLKIRSGGKVGFFMRNSGVGLDGAELIGDIVMQAGKKYRVVVTRNGATYRAYVNGAFDKQITNGSASTTASATCTTGVDWDRGTAYERLTGQIFDPVVYGSALTDEEVMKDYYSTINGL